MKLSEHIIIEMYGVKKRVGDIKSLFHSIEKNNFFQHTTLVSTNNCIIFLYNWGHFIVYTAPNNQMLSVEILSNLGPHRNTKIKQNILGVFQPHRHDVQELTRPLEYV